MNGALSIMDLRGIRTVMTRRMPGELLGRRINAHKMAADLRAIPIPVLGHNRGQSAERLDHLLVQGVPVVATSDQMLMPIREVQGTTRHIVPVPSL